MRRIVPRYPTLESLLKHIGRISGISAELIYLPFCLFKYEIMGVGFGDKLIREEGLLLVDLENCTPINVLSLSELKWEKSINRSKRNIIQFDETEILEEKLLPPKVEFKDAKKRGLWVLRWDLMQVLGKFRYKYLSIFPEEDSMLVYYPYWIVYRNSRGKTTFDVWDALNGAKEGNQIKKAVVIGLEELIG